MAAWGVAKGSAEKRFTGARDDAAGAWLAALQQAQASAAEQLRSAQQRWNEVQHILANLNALKSNNMPGHVCRSVLVREN